MKKLMSLIALTVVAAALWTAPMRAEEAKKPTEVRVCPMAGKAVVGDGAGNVDFKTYKVFFCCGGCKGNFAKLSDEDKQKKIDAALKTQNEAPKA